MKCRQLLCGAVLLGAVVLGGKDYLLDDYEPSIEVGHHLIMGKRQYLDELLFNKTIKAKKSKNGTKVSKDVRWPPEPDSSDYSITYIEVKDIDKGGLASVPSGGYTYHFAVFHLESQEGKGFEFQITIFGFTPWLD